MDKNKIKRMLKNNEKRIHRKGEQANIMISFLINNLVRDVKFILYQVTVAP